MASTARDAPIRELVPKEYPPLLREINDPPKKLYVRGALPTPETALLSVVGSRRASSYGSDVLRELISGLAKYPIAIISGLALGIDALAHRTALETGLHTVAVPGSGLGWNVLYPRMHVRLAQEILESGGALISEFPEDFTATPWSFPKRNRIMAGLSHATLIIEAGKKSGTLITARLAMEYNRDVLVVPAPILVAHGVGSNQLLRLGATPITCTEDILEALHIDVENINPKQTHMLSPSERKVLEFLTEPLPRDEIIRQLGVPISEANILLSSMELRGIIVERYGKIFTHL